MKKKQVNFINERISELKPEAYRITKATGVFSLNEGAHECKDFNYSLIYVVPQNLHKYCIKFIKEMRNVL